MSDELAGQSLPSGFESVSKGIYVPRIDEWDVCRDFLDSLAERFEDALLEWEHNDENQQLFFNAFTLFNLRWRLDATAQLSDLTGQEMRDFAQDYPECSFALVWLSVNISVELSREVENRLRYTVEEVQSFFINEIKALSASMESNVPVSILPYNSFNLAKIAKEKEDIGECELGIRLTSLRIGVWRLCVYLRQLSAVLKAQLQGRPNKKADIRGQPDDVIDARDKWLYERASAGIVYKKILNDLKKKVSELKWPEISSENGIRNRANAYAKRNNLPALLLRREPK